MDSDKLTPCPSMHWARSAVITFRLAHHHSEEPDGSVHIAEPAAVKPEGDGGLGDHGPVTDPGTEMGDRRTCGSQGGEFRTALKLRDKPHIL